ncbi:MAG: MFS transporter [Acidobacteria bacterium]|nr:MFS transporter [Acidobacteriota bacterium]
MTLLEPFRALNVRQRRAFVACFLGWSLDAFDFFLLTYCLEAVGSTFHLSLKVVAESLFWTLAMRPLGALLFGWMAERVGRRPTLMLNIACFSIFELASAFAPSWPVFLLSRALFGVAMGGEWGVGAALAMETLPAKSRGFFSGLLQEGYVVGNLLAAAVFGAFGLFVAHFHPHGFVASWRMLFVIGALPSLLVVYVRSAVEESPAWEAGRARRGLGARRLRRPMRQVVREGAGLVWRYGGSFLFLIVLMFSFNSLSHGTQDLYPTFLRRDGLAAPTVSAVAMVGMLGALLGGLVCGTMSERLGRRRTILAAVLLAIPMIPLWAWSHTAVMLAVGGFLMQFMVQGAWGVIPVHLNELAPPAVRAIFPGLAYQLGNLLASRNGVFQAGLAARFYGGRLGPVMAWTVLLVAVLVALVTWLGPEARGADLSQV